MEEAKAEDTILIPVGRGWNRVDKDGPMRISYPCLKSYEQRGRTLLSFRSRPVKLASGREPKRKEGDVTSRLKRIKQSELYKSAWPRPPTRDPILCLRIPFCFTTTIEYTTEYSSLAFIRHSGISLSVPSTFMFAISLMTELGLNDN